MCRRKVHFTARVDICLNVFKRKYLMNIVIVSQKPIQSLNLIYLLGGIDVFPSAVVIVKPSKKHNKTFTKRIFRIYG